MTGPWCAVEYIGDERVGPHGGRSRLLTLSCGHLFAWRGSTPRSLFKKLRSHRQVPARVRCLLCPPPARKPKK